LLMIFVGSAVFAAYHHEGEQDANRFLAVYPNKAGTKLDHCALCHSGGEYEKKPGKWVSLGSCQWCHYAYGYDGLGQGGLYDIYDTMNPYGMDYLTHGRSTGAIAAIEEDDSDGDGYTNIVEINAERFPGDPNDDPSKVVAPFRVYTMAQLEAMTPHTQFMLMNASRQEDEYSEYTGVPVQDLLQDAGILDSATGILVYAPDGWSNYHPLEEDPEPELYHVNGTYPPASFRYHTDADIALNPVDGWCDYSAPSCVGRSDGDVIAVPGGLKMILAYKRDGAYLDPGILNEDNKLDGEGPFRLVPPQKNPGPPDQCDDESANQDVVWPYDPLADHNKGAASRTATIIKVEPLPEGTTDIDVFEAGWSYVDQEKIVIYGAIEGDSDGNGIPDSEEGRGDFDNDGIPDCMDKDTANLRHSEGLETVCLHTPKGEFADVQALSDDDPAVPQSGKPSLVFPFGTISFKIIGLDPGESVVLTIAFPDDLSTEDDYKVYKIDVVNGWHEVPFGDDDGDNIITITLTDGDPETDGDFQKDGTITDPNALGLSDVAAEAGAEDYEGGSSGWCFITTASH
jgi:hypothetical protein